MFRFICKTIWIRVTALILLSTLSDISLGYPFDHDNELRVPLGFSAGRLETLIRDYTTEVDTMYNRRLIVYLKTLIRNGDISKLEKTAFLLKNLIRKLIEEEDPSLSASVSDRDLFERHIGMIGMRTLVKARLIRLSEKAEKKEEYFKHIQLIARIISAGRLGILMKHIFIDQIHNPDFQDSRKKILLLLKALLDDNPNILKAAALSQDFMMGGVVRRINTLSYHRLLKDVLSDIAEDEGEADLYRDTISELVNYVVTGPIAPIDSRREQIVGPTVVEVVERDVIDLDDLANEVDQWIGGFPDVPRSTGAGGGSIHKACEAALGLFKKGDYRVARDLMEDLLADLEDLGDGRMNMEQLMDKWDDKIGSDGITVEPKPDEVTEIIKFAESVVNDVAKREIEYLDKFFKYKDPSGSLKYLGVLNGMKDMKKRGDINLRDIREAIEAVVFFTGVSSKRGAISTEAELGVLFQTAGELNKIIERNIDEYKKHYSDNRAELLRNVADGLKNSIQLYKDHEQDFILAISNNPVKIRVSEFKAQPADNSATGDLLVEVKDIKSPKTYVLADELFLALSGYDEYCDGMAVLAGNEADLDIVKAIKSLSEKTGGKISAQFKALQEIVESESVIFLKASSISNPQGVSGNEHSLYRDARPEDVVKEILWHERFHVLQWRIEVRALNIWKNVFDRIAGPNPIHRDLYHMHKWLIQRGYKDNKEIIAREVLPFRLTIFRNDASTGDLIDQVFSPEIAAIIKKMWKQAEPSDKEVEKLITAAGKAKKQGYQGQEQYRLLETEGRHLVEYRDDI